MYYRYILAKIILSNGSLHKSDVNSLYNHWGVPRDKSRESKKNPRILVYRTLSDLLSDYIMSLLQLSFDHFPNSISPEIVEEIGELVYNIA